MRKDKDASRAIANDREEKGRCVLRGDNVCHWQTVGENLGRLYGAAGEVTVCNDTQDSLLHGRDLAYFMLTKVLYRDVMYCITGGHAGLTRTSCTVRYLRSTRL